MRIIGHGIDLVHVERIARLRDEHGGRFLERCFTPGERAHAGDGPRRDEHLAARFAAKEATLKVLRPERHWFDWRQIEVVRHSGGWVELALHGAARAQAEAEGLHRFSLSLSHEHDYAIAVVCAAP